MVSMQSAQALQNYQTTTNWFTQTYNSKSSQAPIKPYSFKFPTFSNSLYSDKVAGGLAEIITSANQLHTSVNAFGNTGSALLNNRVVTSSDITSVKATALNGTDLKSTEISVYSIAASQTNSGAAFHATSPTSLQTGSQKFAITMGNKTTNVSFFANATDTHQKSLDKIKNAINASDSGVNAKVVKDPVSSMLHLELASKETGTTHAFTIADVNGSAVSSTGIQSVSTAAADATYRVNGGKLLTSNSNQILVDNGKISATLLKPTSSSVTLTSKPDSDAIIKQTKQLVKDYNTLQNQISDESSFINPSVKRNLQNALISNDLDTLGISKQTDGTLTLDDTKLKNNINSHFDQVSRSINGPSGIASALSKATDRLQSSPAEALLNQNNSSYKQYKNYQSTLQFYTQLQTTGLLLNNFF
jgi:flagellar hook-associated protein 2